MRIIALTLQVSQDLSTMGSKTRELKKARRSRTSHLGNISDLSEGNLMAEVRYLLEIDQQDVGSMATPY